MEPPEKLMGGGAKAGASCQSCRRRKLRCSKERPACEGCRYRDVDCVYSSRGKPGMRPGAIESLQNRIDVLEEAMLDMSEQPLHFGKAHDDCCRNLQGTCERLKEAISLLSTEIHRQASVKEPAAIGNSVTESPSAHAYLEGQAEEHNVDEASLSPKGTYHRKRKTPLDIVGQANGGFSRATRSIETKRCLPPLGILERTIRLYFKFVHPWIPILHENSFWERFNDPARRRPMEVILHAMVAAALRFDTSSHKTSCRCNDSARGARIEDDHGPKRRRADGSEISSGERPWTLEQQIDKSRRAVLFAAMETMSVESIQALSILAFDDLAYLETKMGSGEMNKASSNIALAGRMIDCLHLNVEPDTDCTVTKKHPDLLVPSGSLVEEEERRRCFWAVVNHDRFLSVATGDKVIVKNICRKLPVESDEWLRGDNTSTPALSEPSQRHSLIGIAPKTSAEPLKTSYACFIEATECVMRVQNEVVQTAVSFGQSCGLDSWLECFHKHEILIAKSFSSCPAVSSDGDNSDTVDVNPNISLAHVNYNTAAVLLHQTVAFPEPHWTDKVMVLSSVSAGKCIIAAETTAAIASELVRRTDHEGPIASQLAYCAFVNARFLLLYSRFYNTALSPDYWILAQTLVEMTDRWVGPVSAAKASRCLATKYTGLLTQLCFDGRRDPRSPTNAVGAPVENSICNGLAQTTKLVGHPGPPEQRPPPALSASVLQRTNAESDTATAPVPAKSSPETDSTTQVSDMTPHNSNVHFWPPGDGLWLVDGAYPSPTSAFVLEPQGGFTFATDFDDKLPYPGNPFGTAWTWEMGPQASI